MICVIIFLCCPVLIVIHKKLLLFFNNLIIGIIFIASGLVPNTITMQYFFLERNNFKC